jgi:GDP-D-mannose 3', 5'-epimerase
MKKAIVMGGGGFIGSHLVNDLKVKGHWVRGVDLKYPEFSETNADDFVIGDLRNPDICRMVVDQPFDEIYQLAADMGGANFVFTGEHDADIMHNSALINLNVLDAVVKRSLKAKIFYSSSACAYPLHNQLDPNNPICSEDSAYPANPDSEYGWEKLFSERMYFSFARNYGLNVRVARFHNIFGPYGTYDGGREKAPALFCRKVALAKSGDTIEIYGDGKQTRSFLYIDECIEGIMRFMNSDFCGPLNIGSEEMVSINRLVEVISKIAGKSLTVSYAPGPIGVQGRNSDNRLIKEKLGWAPSNSLHNGLVRTYSWIWNELKKNGRNPI